MIDLYQMLRRPLPQLGILRPHVAFPILHTGIAREKFDGDLTMIIELRQASMAPEWYEVHDFSMTVDSASEGIERRLLRPFPPGYRHDLYAVPGSQPASVFELLGYLATAGTLPATICAPEPVMFRGNYHIAFWSPLPHRGYGLVMPIVDTTDQLEGIRATQRSHWLVSEPVPR